MKKRFKNLVKAAVALSVAGTMLLCGCGTETAVEDFEFTGYPMQSDTTLTYFMATSTNLTSICENYGESAFAKALKERTGVNITYVHPVAGQESQTLALYAASDELPDLVENNWYRYTGGPEKAIDENLILPLNDLIEAGEMPNFKKYLEKNPEIDRMIQTDSGQYYAVPFIRGDAKLLVSTGPIIRQDWMEDLGLSAPQSVADLEKILTQFKEKKGAAAPLSVVGLNSLITFAGGFLDFYVDSDGKVQYGLLDDSFKTAVETLHNWYQKGLVDKDFVSLDNATLDSNILNGKTGVTFAAGGSGLGKWLQYMEESDPQFNLSGFALPYALMTGNLTSEYAGYGSVAISAKCKNPKLAARFLDYGFSEEGNMLYNFGVEGVSYTMENGVPTYTDLIMDNPDGWTIAQAMLYHFRAADRGPFVQRVEYIDQYYSTPQQAQALTAWISRAEIEAPMTYPRTTLTADENNEYSTIMTEVEAKAAERVTEFINGSDSMDNYDKLISDIKKLNIDRAIALKQAALDRYNTR